jgi:hypothetical protein
MHVTCAHCSFTTEIDATLLPATGMQGLCPRCRQSIPLGGWTAMEPLATAGVTQVVPPVEMARSEDTDYQVVDEGKVSLVNIIVLLFIIDSTLSLISRVPGLSGIFGSGPELTFHQRAKYLYDTLMAAGFFVAAFGLMFRKNWARLVSIWLLGLGLAEGLYMLTYQYVTVAELERTMNEKLPELQSTRNAKIIGCLLYAFFIVKLNTRAIKARFD